MKTLWDLKFCFKVAFLRLETGTGNLRPMPKCMFERSEKLSKITKFYALLCTFGFGESKTFEANKWDRHWKYLKLQKMN